MPIINNSNFVLTTVTCDFSVLILDYYRSVNARFARRIVGQSNFTCPFQIDQSQSNNLKSISFLYRI